MSATSDILVLTQYPIVDRLRTQLAEMLGSDSENLVVSTLAAGGYLNLVRQLRSRRYREVYVVIADDTALPLIPVLKILSLAIPARTRYVISPGGRVSGYGYLGSLIDGLRIATTLILGGGAVCLNGLRGRWLLWQPRIHGHWSETVSERRLAYLRTNLWLGVQAGGALTHTEGVLSGFLRRGWHVDFLSPDTLGGTESEGLVHVAVQPEQPYVVPREVNHFLYHRRFTRAALETLRGFAGVIYQRSSIGNFSGVELSRELRMPLILEYNGSESWLARYWGTPYVFPSLVALAEDVSLRHAHLIVTVSEPLKRELISRGVDESRIVVHANGVDANRYDAATFPRQALVSLRDRLGIPEEAVITTFVGTFGPWHGAEVLAAAARRALTEGATGPDLYFIFIGDGVRRQEVEALLAPQIESGRVIVTGLVAHDAVPTYLAISDILASPTIANPDDSPFFGSPTKLFEYMAAAKTVVASDLGQMREILDGTLTADEIAGAKADAETDHNHCGLLVAPGDVEQLAAAIRFAAANSTWRQAAGRNARRRVLERYTWDHHVGAIIDRLREVLVAETRARRRVLINALHSKSGGGVTYLTNVLRHLGRHPELDVHVCIHRSQLRLFENATDQVTLHVLDFDPGFWSLIWFEQTKLPVLARKWGIDVTFSPANFSPLLAPRPVIMLRNALSVAFFERRPIKILYWLMLYLGTVASMIRARRIIAVSEYAARAAGGGLAHLFRKRVEIIHHGVNPSFAGGPATDRDAYTLLVVSDLYVQKNLHTLLKVVSRLQRTNPDVVLKVAGAPVDRSYAEALYESARRLGIQDRVQFIGKVDVGELRELYRRCSLFVFPSTVETFGNPLVEAMASGAPIACSRTAAMPEVVGDAAAFFNPNDLDEMTTVITDLLNDVDRRADLSERAVRRAAAFDWERTVDATVRVLLEAAES